MTSAQPHIDFKMITKSFGAVEVIPPLNLEIQKGEFIVLVGPSGCGKTTTLRMLAGLETITSGEIWLSGRDISNVRPGERDCAMVFQNYALYPHMSVRENIGYAMKVHGTPKDEIDKRVNEAATLLGLEPYLDRKPKNLSGGQRQRVAIGRALVRYPEVFLFDEPLSNLDAKLRVEMRTEIKMLQKRLGTTAVYVTHDQVEAMTMADRVVVMRAGKIEQVASPITLYEEPINKFVANFIGSPAMNFFDVEVQKDGVSVQGQFIPLSKEKVKRLKGKKTVIMGLRPEHIGAGKFKNKIEFECRTLEPLGAHTLVLGNLGPAPIVAQLPPKFEAKSGEICTVSIDMEQAHFFDSETEIRL